MEYTAEQSSQALGLITEFRNVCGGALLSIDMPDITCRPAHIDQVTLEDDMVP